MLAVLNIPPNHFARFTTPLRSVCHFLSAFLSPVLPHHASSNVRFASSPRAGNSRIRYWSLTMCIFPALHRKYARSSSSLRCSSLRSAPSPPLPTIVLTMIHIATCLTYYNALCFSCFTDTCTTCVHDPASVPFQFDLVSLQRGPKYLTYVGDHVY